VNCARRPVARQRGDDPLDVAPMAEASDIAVAAEVPRAGGGLELGGFAEAFDHLVRVGQRRAPMNEKRVHRAAFTAPALQD